MALARGSDADNVQIPHRLLTAMHHAVLALLTLLPTSLLAWTAGLSELDWQNYNYACQRAPARDVAARSVVRLTIPSFYDANDNPVLSTDPAMVRQSGLFCSNWGSREIRRTSHQKDDA